MSDDAITDLNACNRSYPASFVQLEFLCWSILKCPIDDIILDFKYVPQEIHHEFLRRFFPLAALYGDLISPIQVIGVTDNLLVVHNLFTVITILTVVNCIRLYYLSLRNG